MIKQSAKIFSKSLLITMLLFSVFSMSVMSLPAKTHAAPSQTQAAAPDSQCKGNSFFGIPTWYEYLTFKRDPNGNCSVDTANTKGNVVVLVALALIDILLTIAGLVAVAFVVYAGFRLALAQGAPDAIAAGRKSLLNAVIGLAIALLAGQLVGFIAGLLSK